MKIKKRIIQLQKSLKTDRWIEVSYNDAEYHPQNEGFFLEDADEFLENEVMNRELESVSQGTVNGIKYIRLGFGGGKKGGAI